MYRDNTKVIQIGNRKIGGGNPILKCVSGRAWTVAAKHPSRRGNRYGK